MLHQLPVGFDGYKIMLETCVDVNLSNLIIMFILFAHSLGNDTQRSTNRWSDQIFDWWSNALPLDLVSSTGAILMGNAELPVILIANYKESTGIYEYKVKTVLNFF